MFVPYQPKPKPNPLKRKENPNKDQACHHCHVAGHWKRNCPLYIEELRANKKKSEPGAAVSVELKVWSSIGIIPVRRSEWTKRAPNRAMDEEMNSMKVNEVWTEVDPPLMLNCKEYVDLQWKKIWQMDVKTAFLNGRLDEDIYMSNLKGSIMYAGSGAIQGKSVDFDQLRGQVDYQQYPRIATLGLVSYVGIVARDGGGVLLKYLGYERYVFSVYKGYSRIQNLSVTGFCDGSLAMSIKIGYEVSDGFCLCRQ
ncbi:zinc finger, CCHC-type containing protein [Tanacetum coccineum]